MVKCLMANYVKVATVDQVAADQGLRVEAGGQQIAVFKLGPEYYAIGDLCTHSGGSLAEGSISGEEVQCPWHGAKFSVKTGAGLTPPARGNTPCFPVRVNGNDIEVEI